MHDTVTLVILLNGRYCNNSYTIECKNCNTSCTIEWMILGLSQYTDKPVYPNTVVNQYVLRYKRHVPVFCDIFFPVHSELFSSFNR